jgi:hypothetical protein
MVAMVVAVVVMVVVVVGSDVESRKERGSRRCVSVVVVFVVWPSVPCSELFGLSVEAGRGQLGREGRWPAVEIRGGDVGGELWFVYAHTARQHTQRVKKKNMTGAGAVAVASKREEGTAGDAGCRQAGASEMDAFEWMDWLVCVLSSSGSGSGVGWM